MGLVNISSQTPRGETEKIPKDVSSSITHIKKLSDNNWHTWEPTFIDCLQRVHKAKEILYGTITPGDEEYDEDLDVMGLDAQEAGGSSIVSVSVSRWLGTINIDMKGMVTPRSGVSVDGDGDEVDDVGDELYASPATLLLLSLSREHPLRRVLYRGPSSTTPVLLSCVDSFDTAPPPCYPACLAPLCLLSCVDSFDTAPPPQDLLAGLLYTAPPPSTGDVLGPPCIWAGPPCPWSPWRLHSPWRLPSNHALASCSTILRPAMVVFFYDPSLGTLCSPSMNQPMTLPPVRGLAPETQRWLGTISIDTKVKMTPRSGVSADGNEVDDVGDEVIPGPQWTTAFGSIYIRTANLLWAPSDVR
ncbi:uncharacterized protein UDID_19174 [Ustilago sp. UG-2017a]|nr:uncharacterized protein UDID_19174 [Ustilago sp. UG-2017a]